MLVAINEQGEYLALTASLTEAALQQLRNVNVYCPHCKKEMILKAGTIKIPHFAHLANTSCESLFSEGESYLHLLGKQQLFEWLQQLEEDVQLECYLPHLQQRPDLLVTKRRQYALEFQCSRIPLDLFQFRTEGYLRAGIIPVWLLKTPTSFLQKGSILQASFSLFHQQFMQKDYVITYAPETQQFHYFCHTIYLQGNMFLARIISLPLAAQIFPFYEPKRLTEEGLIEMLSEYTRYRLKFLHSRLFYSQKGVNDMFLRAVYELRLPREKLPLFIGVPVPHAQDMQVFSAEWQLLLFYFMYCHGLTPDGMRESTIYYFLSWANLPNSQEALLAVEAYVRILQVLSIKEVKTPCSNEQLMAAICNELIAIN